VRASRWPVEGMYPLTCQVSNKRGAGDIIGLGRMGSAIAVRLSAFGLDRVPQP
jgi:phosphoglycerate dehydrogenase-like enzyme